MGSKETASIIAFARAFDPTVIVTATTNGSHAAGSFHFQHGTDGQGLAVDFDFAGVTSANKRLALARHFESVGNKLAELFYSPMGHSWKYGRQVPWLVPDHFDHVHVATQKGVFLAAVPSAPPLPPPTPAVYGPIVQHGDIMKSQTFTTGSLGPEGNGWIDTGIPFDKFVSLVPLGPSPDRDGYGWANWYWSANMTNGKTRIEIEGGTPGKPVGFVAWSVD